jgi:hypothetical protein
MLERQEPPAWTRCETTGLKSCLFLQGSSHSSATLCCPSLFELQLLQLLRPYSGEDLQWHPVTTEMSKLGYDKPDSCEDVRKKKGAITSFFAKSPPAAKRPAEGPPEGEQESARKTAHAPGAGAIKDEAKAAGEGGPSVKEEEEAKEEVQEAAVRVAGAMWEEGQEADVKPDW